MGLCLFPSQGDTRFDVMIKHPIIDKNETITIYWMAKRREPEVAMLKGHIANMID